MSVSPTGSLNSCAGFSGYVASGRGASRLEHAVEIGRGHDSQLFRHDLSLGVDGDGERQEAAVVAEGANEIERLVLAHEYKVVHLVGGSEFLHAGGVLLDRDAHHRKSVRLVPGMNVHELRDL